MTRVLRTYCHIVTTVNRWLMIGCAALMFIVVPVLCFEVVMRYFFDAPTVWALELSSLLFGPYFMLAGPYLLHIGGHVNVDVLYAWLPPRVAAAVDIVTYPIIFFFALTILYHSWPVAMNAFGMRETSFTPWNPEIWPFKFVVPVAMGLLFLQALAEFLRAWARALGRAEALQ